MTAHPTWEALNDIADGRVNGAGDGDARAHVRDCPQCGAELAALHTVLEGAAGLPQAVDTPAGLWDDVRRSIQSKAQGLGAHTDTVDRSAAQLRAAAPPHVRALHVDRRARPARGFRWQLAAAAAALVVVTSGITTLFVRSVDRGVASAPSDTMAARSAAAPGLSVAFISAERGYASDLVELESLFRAQRGTLSAPTIAVIERSLATIDAAIAEARSALVADPGDHELARLLDASYRQKIALLRRAAELPLASGP